MKNKPAVTLGEVFAMHHPRGLWGAAQVVRVEGNDVEVVVLDHLTESSPSLDAVTTKPLVHARYGHSQELARSHVIDAVPREFVSLGVRAPALPLTPHSGIFGFWRGLVEAAYDEHRWRALPEATRGAWFANHKRRDKVRLDCAGATREHLASTSELHLVIGDERDERASAIVRDGSALDWRVFDALPCLTQIEVKGDHAGLVPWLETRPLVSSLTWTALSVESLDLRALSLRSLTLEARRPLVVKLPASLDELHVRVRGATPITFEAARDGAFLSLHLDVWNDADLDAIRGLTRARELTLEGFDSLDLSRLTRFFGARELVLNGAPGRLSQTDALARFTELRTLMLHRCYDVDAARFPSADAWRSLEEFRTFGLHKRDVQTLKSRWKKGLRPTFSGPVDDDAVRATSGFAVLSWPQRGERPMLVSAYAKAVKALAKSNTLSEVTKALRSFSNSARRAERAQRTSEERADMNATWEMLLAMARERLPEAERGSLVEAKLW